MARKKAAASGLDPNAWMVTFSDLLTLLLTFFVLLISMSSLDASKLRESFATIVPISGVSVFDGPPEPLTGSANENLPVLRRAMIQAIAMEQAKMGSELISLSVPDSSDHGAAGDDSEGDRGASNHRDHAEGDDGEVAPDEGLEIFVDDRGLIIRLPATVTFASGQAELQPVFKALLKIIGKMMIERDLVATIEGHTDDRPIATLRFPSNWELSMARGAAVARFLAGDVGVDPARLAASGYADRRPIIGNQTPGDRQKNRRIEIILNAKHEEKVKNLTDPEQENAAHG